GYFQLTPLPVAEVLHLATKVLYIHLQIENRSENELQLRRSRGRRFDLTGGWTGEHREIISPPSIISDLWWDVARADRLTVREDDHRFDEVAELANVPWPGVVDGDLQRLRIDAGEWPLMLAREFSHETVDEAGDVLAAVAQ